MTPASQYLFDFHDNKESKVLFPLGVKKEKETVSCRVNREDSTLSETHLQNNIAYVRLLHFFYQRTSHNAARWCGIQRYKMKGRESFLFSQDVVGRSVQ